MATMSYRGFTVTDEQIKSMDERFNEAFYIDPATFLIRKKEKTQRTKIRKYKIIRRPKMMETSHGKA